MENRIRVLVIVPYEGMQHLFSSVAEEYPQMDMDVFTGNMEEGVEIAKRSPQDKYDAIISRGGTAQALKQLPLPVIDIEFSLYDILCALKLSNGLGGRFAMVAHANITVSAQILCDLLGYPIDIFTVGSTDELEPVLRQVQEARYDTILCDMTASIIARVLGLNTIFITSGIDSIRRALDQAQTLCRSRERLQTENRFFRELLQGQSSHVVVFDARGDLLFSCTDSLSPELLALLKRDLAEASPHEECRFTRSLNGMLYSIRTRPVDFNAAPCTAVYFSVRKSPFSRSQAGVRFLSRQEAEKEAYSGLFNFHDTFGPVLDEAARLADKTVPIVITGEEGIRMDRIVSHIYVHSPLKNAPLVSINCSLLHEKTWEFLLEHHNSPLTGTGNTIHFSNVDALSTKARRRLIETLAEAEVCRRNRVFFSCICASGEQLSPEAAEFLNRLNCQPLYFQPLRNVKDCIPSLISSALSRLNASLPRPVLGADPEAVQLLQAFGWPHNYMQFQRVIESLAATSEWTIKAEDVRRALQKEQRGSVHTACKGDVSEPLDLSQTLDQISRDVARRVLDETGGNQTAAAKRLGISRTTLRRLITAP